MALPKVSHLSHVKVKLRQVTTSNDVITRSGTTMWLSQVNQATISDDVITKSETTMWLSQVNQATISDDVITKGVST
jgi:hypothetical protein